MTAGMKALRRENAGVREAVEAAGSVSKLARKLGVSNVAVHKYLYQNCPPERAVEIEQATGISRERIRPDIFVRVDRVD